MNQKFFQVPEILVDRKQIVEECQNRVSNLSKPPSVYWATYRYWKRQFKLINPSIKEFDSKERDKIYKEWFDKFYNFK